MLTLKQSAVLTFVRNFMLKKGYAPTTGEIAEGIAIRSRGVVYRYLKALQQEGYIHLVPNKRRNIQLCAKPCTLPVAGTIAAGLPSLAYENVEMLNIADLINGEGRFLLHVKGDSMRNAGIHDGDFAICESAEEADNGDIVVALVDEDNATLKRYQRNTDGSVSLHPANDAFHVQTYEGSRVRIQGRYVALVRTVM